MALYGAPCLEVWMEVWMDNCKHRQVAKFQGWVQKCMQCPVSAGSEPVLYCYRLRVQYGLLPCADRVAVMLNLIYYRKFGGCAVTGHRSGFRIGGMHAIWRASVVVGACRSCRMMQLTHAEAAHTARGECALGGGELSSAWKPDERQRSYCLALTAMGTGPTASLPQPPALTTSSP